jgi:hypothetical protein
MGGDRLDDWDNFDLGDVGSDLQAIAEADDAPADLSPEQRRAAVHGKVVEANAMLFAEGKIDGRPISEVLSALGSDALPMGVAKLWLKTETLADRSLECWLYVMAPSSKDGPQKAGYTVTLAVGKDTGNVVVEVCCLLKALDRDGSSLQFEKAARIMTDKVNGKVSTDGEVTEAELVALIEATDFNINYYHFKL